ncbi:MAG: hypothetical protein IK066_04515 [Kiritimatiellae bacterium]|nr:hypothetical protein [Kiritimatiellia bacterium]
MTWLDAFLAGKKLLDRAMFTAEWRLEGKIDVGEEVRPGWWRVTVPTDNPLRLVHVPTGRKIVVPFREMETDFASVPAAAQAVGDKVGALHVRPRDYEEGAFFHDELYEAGWAWAVMTVEVDGKPQPMAIRVPVTKEQADAALFCCLQCRGATLADGMAYGGAVALFGKSHWEAARKKSPAWPETICAAEEPPRSDERRETSDEMGAEPFNSSTLQPFNGSEAT